jgi:hypothetical protein
MRVVRGGESSKWKLGTSDRAAVASISGQMSGKED